jgi:hypothetical protein
MSSIDIQESVGLKGAMIVEYSLLVVGALVG